MFRVLILARDSDTALRLCVSPLLRGPSRHRLLQRGQGQGGSKVSVQVGWFRSGQEGLSGCHLTPGLSRPVPSPSLSPAPFLSISPTSDTLEFSVTAVFLCLCARLPYPLTPFLAAAISPARNLASSKDYLGSLSLVSFPFPSISCTLPHSHSPTGLPSSASLPSVCSLFTHTLS